MTTALDPIRTAIIGYGYMGEIRHRVLGQNADFEVVAIVDGKARPDGVSDGIVWKRELTAVRELEVDVVFVCLPHNLSPGVVCDCLADGRHVFCEKPPGKSLADVEAMAAAAKGSVGELVFGFNHRFQPGVSEAKRIADSGELGELLWLKGTYGKSGGAGFEESWRNRPEISGGGILLDQGCHMLDLFNFFAGNFCEVESFLSTSCWEIPVEDNAFVIMRNPSGQHAMLHSSATLWKHTFKLELGFTEGYLAIDGLLSKSGSYGRQTLTLMKRERDPRPGARGIPVTETTSYDLRDPSWEIEVARFARVVRGVEKNESCTVEDARRVMEIVERAYADAAVKKGGK